MTIKFGAAFVQLLVQILPAVLTLGACSSIKIGGDDYGDLVSVSITGVHHLGGNFNIGELYIDDNYGSNVGRNGGGGSHFCCTALPNRWHPGLTATVSWSVNNWSNVIRSEIDSGNYSSLAFQDYVATVPIERYEEVGDLYPHFFPNGKVRLVSSNYPITSLSHPIQRNDASAVKLATQGVEVYKK